MILKKMLVFFSNLLHETSHSDTLKKFRITITYYNSETYNIHTSHRTESNNRVLSCSMYRRRRDSMGTILKALIAAAAVVLEEILDDDD